MKNFIYWLSIVMAIVFIGSNCIACSDDDEQVASDSSIVGVWECYNEEQGTRYVVEFDKDGWFDMTVTQKEENYISNFYGDYSLNDGILTIYETWWSGFDDYELFEEGDRLRLTISKDSFYFMDGSMKMVFTRLR